VARLQQQQSSKPLDHPREDGVLLHIFFICFWIFFSKGFSPEIITLAFLKSFYRCKISHFTRQKRDPPFKIFLSAGTYLKV
jgi:multisubunit Na+/H+ antiporter MnhE subunit